MITPLARAAVELELEQLATAHVRQRCQRADGRLGRALVRSHCFGGGGGGGIKLPGGISVGGGVSPLGRAVAEPSGTAVSMGSGVTIKFPGGWSGPPQPT